MTKSTTTKPERTEVDTRKVMFDALAAGFDADWIEKLPKPVARDGVKGRCEDTPRQSVVMSTG